MNDIKNTLLKKIKDGEVTMVPQSRFVLQAGLWAFGAVISLFLAVYLLSFVLFTLNRSGVLFAPLYGWHGVVLFVVSSPWLLISLTGMFLLILFILVSHYAFSYKKPLVYSMVAIVLVVLGGSSLIQQTTMHQRVQNFTEQNQVPGLTPLYKEALERRPDMVTVGVVSSLQSGNLVLTAEDTKTYEVRISERTKLPRGRALWVNDQVMVFGPKTENVIEACGVRPMDAPHGARLPGRLPKGD